jgi:GNAT superfamily N-acetyltransferase
LHRSGGYDAGPAKLASIENVDGGIHGEADELRERAIRFNTEEAESTEKNVESFRPGGLNQAMSVIRELTGGDVDAYVELRRRALLDVPLAFSASPEDDFVGSVEAVREQLARAPEWTIYGAFMPELAGVAGVFRDRRIKAAHKAHIWGVYVQTAHRGHGIAAQLLAAAVQHARSLAGVTWVQLTKRERQHTGCAAGV